ncbi:MAG: phosphopantetheine-binding protein [Pseudomonadales bacterium]|jgi:acyl carrier protein
MTLASQVKEIITDVLQLDYTIDGDTALMGAIPEFDSMAVITILTTLEEQFGMVIDDDEVDASIFETVDALVNFVEEKV